MPCVVCIGTCCAHVAYVQPAAACKNKNCHFCEHAPKRSAFFACLNPSCDQVPHIHKHTLAATRFPTYICIIIHIHMQHTHGFQHALSLVHLCFTLLSTSSEPCALNASSMCCMVAMLLAACVDGWSMRALSWDPQHEQREQNDMPNTARSRGRGGRRHGWYRMEASKQVLKQAWCCC